MSKRPRLVKRSDSDEEAVAAAAAAAGGAATGPAFSVARGLASIRSMAGYSGQLGESAEDVFVQPARQAEFGEVSAKTRESLDDQVWDKYASLIGGSDRLKLYSHQVAAIEGILAGKNVVLSTSTASGKSLAFNFPILSTLKRTDATAIYLFPSKALAQDQKRVLDNLLADGASAMVKIYDGDSEAGMADEIVREGKLILTNPDKIHCTMLAEHSKFRSFFARLKFVVVDEAHAYDGAFGSHVAAVLRRLVRTVRFCRRQVLQIDSSLVQFVCCSATIGNALEHAVRLTGASDASSWLSVARDGSPCGARTTAVYRGTEDVGEAEQVGLLVGRLVEEGGRVIVFCGSRAEVERLVVVVRKYVACGERIVGYRGGYSAEERRRLEKQIFGNAVDVVICTNALELGIDVGSLDVCICVGYPGSVHSLRQRFGRAGRGEEQEALEILFCKSRDVIDEYLGAERRRLLELPLENAVVQTDNLPIVASHLLCAWWEIKKIDFDEFDRKCLFPDCDAAFEVARRTGIGLKKRPDVQIRSPAKDKVIVQCNDVSIDEYDLAVGLFFVYEGAALVVQGQEFLVVEVARYKAHDVSNNKEDGIRKYIATAIRCVAPLDYFTQHIGGTEILPQFPMLKVRPVGNSGAQVEYGKMLIKAEITGYRKLHKKTREIIGHDEPLKPDQLVYWTRGVRLNLGSSGAAPEALHGLTHMLLRATQLTVLCGKGDLKVDCLRADGSLLLYDGRSGGLGVAEVLFARFPEICAFALAMCTRCVCSDGCVKCVHHSGCSQRQAAVEDKPNKAATVALLALLVS